MKTRFCMAMVLALSFSLSGQTPKTYPQMERVAETGRLWSRLRWVHPALAEGKVEWDRQLVEALPAMASAETPQAQKAVLERMLAPLKDASLRIGPPIEPKFVVLPPNSPRTASLPSGGVLVSLHDSLPAHSPEFADAVASIKKALSGADRVVIDLRPTMDAAGENTDDYLKALLPGLMAKTLDPPAGRFLYVRGWPAQSFSTSGVYYTAWLAQHTEPFRSALEARVIPMAFVIDCMTTIPPIVLSLQKAGLAHIVTAGDTPNLIAPMEVCPFGESFEIAYRVGEWGFSDGKTAAGVDQMVAEGTQVGVNSPAVKAALGLLDSMVVPGSKLQWRTVQALPVRDQENAYQEMTFPTLAWRQFAVIRFWSVVDGFFPYKDLMDQPWSNALPEFLAEMEKVNDSTGYAQVLARMAARLQDNHVKITGHPFFDALRGEAGLPVTFRMVENAVLVGAILDPLAAQGLQLWDELLEVDGEPVATWMARTEPYMVAANPWTMKRNLVAALGRGLDGSSVRVKVKGPNGPARELVIQRSSKFPMAFPKTLHAGDPIQVLAGGIAYVDLARLVPSEVDSMFDKIKDTSALVLDMRGYPKGTAWDIAPRLNVRKASAGAFSFTSVVSALDGPHADSSSVSAVQKLPPSMGKPFYTGKVVMLIDEQTQSQGEHTGLFFEAACGATFIGSPSAGSDGDVTDIRLPGGVVVRFSGLGVRHADGRQLQRVGLQPKVLVRPTINGARDGRDEVMDRAVRYIQE